MISLTFHSWMIPLAVTLVSVGLLYLVTPKRDWASGLVVWIFGLPLVSVFSAVSWIVWAVLK